MIHYEQAVYGSFPFWHRGYDILAHSPGCRPEWLGEFRAACQRFGEPSRAGEDANAAGAVFALRLPEKGPWLIAGVCPQGTDDHGRPGALAFHGLFVGTREFRKIGYDPFLLTGALCRQWGAETTTLPAGTWRHELSSKPPSDDPGDLSGHIARTLAHGRRVALEADRPIDDLARRVWKSLTDRVRQRSSVATFAFGNGNHFDLVAVPRLTSLDLDPSYVSVEALAHDVGPARPRWWTVYRSPRIVGSVVALMLLVTLGSWWALRGFGKRPFAESANSLSGIGSEEGARLDNSPVPRTSVDRSYPRRDAFRASPTLADDERMLVIEGLLDFAARFGVLEALGSDPDEEGPDPTQLMIRLSGAFATGGRR